MSFSDECPSFGNQSLDDGMCAACLNKKRALFKACNIATIKKAKEAGELDNQELPKRYNIEIGRMHVMKGKDHTDTKQIVTWETVKPCRGERCPAFEMCEYNAGQRKCRVESVYLRAVASIIYRNYISVLDEPTLMRVGMHLMPIYQNLCRLKIAEVGIANMVETDAKGKSTISPIYKEMREHIKLLEQTWRSLGLTQYFIESSSAPLAPPDVDVEFSDSEEKTVPLKKRKPIKRGE